MKKPGTILLSLLLFAAALPAAEWAHFRGPNGNNALPDSEIASSFPASGPTVLWSVDVNGGYGGAAIAGEDVYVMDRADQERDIILCLDLADGQERWRWEYEVPGRISHPGSRVVPTVTEDAVYASSGFGHVYCLDRTSHQARWVFDVAKEFNVQPPRFGYSVHPVIAGDYCIIAPTSDTVGLAALDTKTGSVVWRSEPVGSSHSSPILTTVLGRRILVMPGSADGTLILGGFDPTSGETLFRFTDPLESGRHNAIPNISMIGDDGAFFTGGYGQGTLVLKFAETDGAITVERTNKIAAGATLHPVLVVGEQAYMTAGRGRGGRRSSQQPDSDSPSGLICMNLQGDVLWSTGREPSLGGGSLIAAGGILISQDGTDGTLRLIEPGAAFNELASAQVFSKPAGEEPWAPLALSGGKLVMRSNSQVVCVDLAD